MGSILEIIRQRRSIRQMRRDPIPDEVLQSVLEAARLAPSWANRQCWRFIVVRDEDQRKALATAGGPRDAMSNAPVIVVAAAIPSQSGVRDGLEYFMLDMGIAVEHLILEATAQGLGSCWVGFFKEEIVRDTLRLPKNMRVVAMVPLGYPAEQPAARDRLALEEIVSYDRCS
ncbi:MAG: nitroreductase family protein [Chloroflexota bacterium]